ncbi:DOMON-like domain-containing protein [Sphingomonas alpina]|uniref:DOMON-like domain-containing protein n=1 Tax=Sphingomonas alpina TaxID=653931 RepID=A0A7H0LPC4_9SPHN|nr:DOMON-like domain-containing protein [Sphingomonas alpina]QNQ11527.1 DOMON-like domain-containing protein [Sphingomonas alpina]
MAEFELIPHPALPRGPLNRVTVTAERPSRDLLTLHYHVAGAIDAVLWPVPIAPAFTDNLWQHSCFEAFIAPGAGDDYTELNASPSGGWAIYEFDGYRDGMRNSQTAQYENEGWRMAPDAAELTVSLTLPLLADGTVWQVGLTAVIEAKDGTKSFWALTHPTDTSEIPDFHNRDCFTAELAAPTAA